MDGLMDWGDSFGQWLKKRRKALDLTQDALAKRVGCSVATIEKIEAEQRRPSRQIAELLAEALEVPPAERPIFLKIARGERSAGRLGGVSPLQAHPRRTNLPVPAAPLIGRQPELAEIARLLASDECRLLTLAGTGGIGKTRLAIQAAADQDKAYPGGVYFVALAGVNDAEFIAPAIAESLSFTFYGPTPPQRQLLHHLRDQELLLVLDNYEHLLPEVDLIVEILHQACGVKLLVTSREPLGVSGEWIFDVQGLPVPRTVTGELEANSAVALFLQSARRIRLDYQLGGADAQHVVRICQMVEGMPLGIELAASWVRVLTCAEIAQEIERSLGFLATSLRGVPERHRSLEAVFEHSWNLLGADEQRLLQGLSVFRGGFTRLAAEQVAGASLAQLAGLVSRSLVRRAEGGRYDLHEVVRQFAFSHLAGDPQYETIRDRHSDFYLRMLADQYDNLKGAGQHQAIRLLSGDIDNIREAWAWAAQRENFALIGSALRSLGWLSNIVGWLQEGLDQIEPVVRALRGKAKDRELQKVLGSALAQQGLLYFRQGRFEPALASYEDSLTILRPLGDSGELVHALLISAIILHLYGAMDQAKARVAQSLASAQVVGHEWFAAYALFNLGYIASLTGSYEEGYQQMLDGLARWRILGDPSSIALGLNYISPTAILLGRIDEAQAYLQESLALSTQVGDWWGVGTARRNLGLAALARGDYAEARAQLHKSLDIFGDIVVGWDIARSLDYLGRVGLAEGDLAEARKHFLQGLRVALEVRTAPVALDIFVGLARLHACAGEFKEALALSLCALKDPAGTYETHEAASQVIALAESHLAAWSIQSVREQVGQRSLGTIAETVLGGYSEGVSPS